MTCPRCFAEFKSGPGKCPECGVRFVHNISGVVKTSGVMIAAAGERGFYRSVQEVPEPLRTKLLASTKSVNSGTIVIADRAGKEQITHIVGRREAAARDRSLVAAPLRIAARRKWPGRMRDTSFLGISGTLWIGIVLLLIASGSIAVVFAIH
jgi:hypothetical protein